MIHGIVRWHLKHSIGVYSIKRLMAVLQEDGVVGVIPMSLGAQPSTISIFTGYCSIMLRWIPQRQPLITVRLLESKPSWIIMCGMTQSNVSRGAGKTIQI
ncbi:hypothetical protein D3C76_1035540 [compost metagenome]